MADIVDDEVVAIIPSAHVELLGGSQPIMPKGAVGEDVTYPSVVDGAKSVLCDVELDALPDEAAPLIVADIGRIRRGVGIETGGRPPVRMSRLIVRLRRGIGSVGKEVFVGERRRAGGVG
jgi:hypothetical protein